MGDLGIAASGWRTLPLCRSYLLVLVHRIQIEVKDSASPGRILWWALGVLRDGQYEVLGVWSALASRAKSWHEIFESLRASGAERIQFVSSSESAELHAALSTAYPHATVLPPIWTEEAFSEIPLRRRPPVLAGMDAIRELQLGADRAIKRNGCFSSLSHATAYVRDALERAEQRIWAVQIGSKVGLTDARGRTSSLSLVCH